MSIEVFSSNGGKCEADTINDPRDVSGFANIEEDFVDEKLWSANLPLRGQCLPCQIEDELKKIGINYVQAGLWKGFAIHNGNLNNPNQ
jgi:hypothetical protein